LRGFGAPGKIAFPLRGFGAPGKIAFPLRGFGAPGKLSSGQFSAENGRQPRQVAQRAG